MAQTSTTLSGAKSHIENITGTDISFTSSGGTFTISSTSTELTGSGKLAVRDIITVTGTTNNNSTFTVKSVDSTDDFNGNIKMQGSLATTPTEDDFFDIDGTTMTSDQSTKIASFNFTGNFVWVRAKVTTTNQTSNPSLVTSILLNN